MLYHPRLERRLRGGLGRNYLEWNDLRRKCAARPELPRRNKYLFSPSRSGLWVLEAILETGDLDEQTWRIDAGSLWETPRVVSVCFYASCSSSGWRAVQIIQSEQNEAFSFNQMSTTKMATCSLLRATLLHKGRPPFL